MTPPAVQPDPTPADLVILADEVAPFADANAGTLQGGMAAAAATVLRREAAAWERVGGPIDEFVEGLRKRRRWLLSRALDVVGHVRAQPVDNASSSRDRDRFPCRPGDDDPGGRT